MDYVPKNLHISKKVIPLQADFSKQGNYERRFS